MPQRTKGSRFHVGPAFVGRGASSSQHGRGPRHVVSGGAPEPPTTRRLAMSGQEVQKIKVAALKQTTVKASGAAQLGFTGGIASQTTVQGSITYGLQTMATINLGSIASDATNVTVMWNGQTVFVGANNPPFAGIPVTFTDGATHVLRITLGYSGGS